MAWTSLSYSRRAASGHRGKARHKGLIMSKRAVLRERGHTWECRVLVLVRAKTARTAETGKGGGAHIARPDSIAQATDVPPNDETM